MLIIVDSIIFGFVLFCGVLIGLFITVISLEGMRDIHRRLMGGEYNHWPPSGAQQIGGSVGIV
jgi:hypothetical protein